LSKVFHQKKKMEVGYQWGKMKGKTCGLYNFQKGSEMRHVGLGVGYRTTEKRGLVVVAIEMNWGFHLLG